MWQDKLKELGVNIHVAATGGGASLQNKLWSVPGCSAYFSGASFPYSPEEQEEFLGFKPEHFCSEEAAVDLASAAYMKAYKFGGKKPVGVGITASLASVEEHRGDHRFYVCVMTDDKSLLFQKTLAKGKGMIVRKWDGETCDEHAFQLLSDALQLSPEPFLDKLTIDASELAKTCFWKHPFFTATGKRLDKLPKEGKVALMPGAFNPPHEGHFGAAQSALDECYYRTVFEITADPPHKDALSVQAMLQRAKLLQGQDRLFTQQLPLYIDKARKYPKRPIILGADAMIRLLDPKWGPNIMEMFSEFYDFGTKLLVAGREVNGVFTTCEDILSDIHSKYPFKDWASAQIVMKPLKGQWDISSTELRNKQQ
jgi:nicotinamide mononucleotide (NMN) deamidase PncC